MAWLKKASSLPQVPNIIMLHFSKFRGPSNFDITSVQKEFDCIYSIATIATYYIYSEMCFWTNYIQNKKL